MAVNKLDITMMEDVGTSANQLLQRDGSGNIPAIDGSQVTGLSEFTTSTSDPLITTNPAGGVGSLWYNKTSGEMYVCTDATAGENVWTNVGEGSGDVAPWFYGGTQYGYIYGGNSGPATSLPVQMEKWSMTSDANSTNVGDMAVGRSYVLSGQRSVTHGYCAGGHVGNPRSDVIEKWQFSNDGDGTDIANLTLARGSPCGSSSTTHCYSVAGYAAPYSNVIDKFSTSSDVNATDVGDAVSIGSQGGGFSSDSYGYKAGNWVPPATNVIEKYSFSADGDATDVANLTVAGSGRVSSSSETHGYLGPGGGRATTIDKHNFASGADATDVGDTPSTAGTGGCASSAANGYFTFGAISNNTINKYSHISDGNSADIADIITVRNEAGGTHY